MSLYKFNYFRRNYMSIHMNKSMTSTACALFCEKRNSYIDQLSVCLNGQTEINTNTIPREIIWKSGNANVSLFPAHVNGSIDLINCLGTRNLFLSKDRVYPGESPFSSGQKWYKSGASRAGWKNWANPPGGEKVGVGALSGNLSMGKRTEDDKRREDERGKGFNKFLRRSLLSGANHTIIGRLKNIRLSCRGIIVVKQHSGLCNM